MSTVKIGQLSIVRIIWH